ncbi:MAG: cellulase family glycosylhydrolase [Deltaproteobacteria bacterium]|nr:cellulase family glycosylhydrolase [Deltaproteobacteria bacterium]
MQTFQRSLGLPRRILAIATLTFGLAACGGSANTGDGGVLDASSRDGASPGVDASRDATLDSTAPVVDASRDATLDATPDATPDSAAPDGSAARPGVLQIDPADPHRLLRDGRPWQLAGYYPGAAFNMTSRDYAGDFQAYTEAYVDLASSHGLNYFRIWINWGTVDAATREHWDAYMLHPYLRTGPGDAVDGKPRVDLDQFNPQYFERIDQAVRYAGDRGMVVQLMLLDCGHIHYNAELADRDYYRAANNINGLDWSTEDEWLDPSGPVFARLRAFVERVVSTVGDQTNIVWETCNEKFGSDISSYEVVASDPFHVAIADIVRAKERELGFPEHLIMPIDLPEHRTVAGHRTPSSWSPESIDEMHRRLADEQFAWNVPLITDNDCCRGEPDAAFMRKKAWAAFTAGAYIDVFNNDMARRAVLENSNTADGMTYIARTLEFVRSENVELVGMVPSDALVSGGAWALARPDQEFVVYLPAGGSTDVQRLPSSFTAVWFNPRDGGTQPAGSGPSFTAPDDSDWVLYIAASG